ncbi:MAG: hypothetical protein AAGF28_02750 [Pseudomonadota bacterium]
MKLSIKNKLSSLPPAGPSIQTWTRPEGSVWADCYRTPHGYRLRYPAFAEFEIDRDNQQIVCSPLDGVGEDTIQHLYTNHVRPLAMGLFGRPMFHGSAVEVDGYAVMFVGVSGMGKSTLALSFATNGFPFLSDDGLLFETDGPSLELQPSAPAIRVWHDVLDTMTPSGSADASSVGEINEKYSLPASSQITYCDTPKPVACVYFLQDNHMQTTSISPLSSADSAVNWLKNSFLIDPTDQDLISRQFSLISDLAARMPAYSLDYPRDFAQLPGVRQSILRHCSTEPAL